MELKTTSIDRIRQPWVDFMRSISILLMVVIHTAAPLAHRWGDIPLREWMTGNFYNSFARVSVPLLFMISGYLLLGRQESIASFYLRRFQKVLIPFLFWSVIYLVWANSYKNYTFINAIKAIIYAIITAPAFFHFWYLYELLAIYLFVPILRLFVQASERIHLWYFAAIWLIFGPLQAMVERIVGFQFAIDLGFFTSYIGFFVIGYLLGKTEFTFKVAGLSGVILILAGGYTMYATYELTKAANDFVQYYYWYTRINIVVMSFAAFIVFKRIGQSITVDWLTQLFRRFAEASFGIYLIHIIVMTYLEQIDIGVFSGSVALTVPMVAGTAILISWGVVAIFQRIPIMRELTPK